MAKLSREKRKRIREQARRRKEFEQKREHLRSLAIAPSGEVGSRSVGYTELLSFAKEIDRNRLLDLAIARAVCGRPDRAEVVQLFAYSTLDRMIKKVPGLYRCLCAVVNPAAHAGYWNALMDEVWTLFRRRIRRHGALFRIIEGRIPLPAKAA